MSKRIPTSEHDSPRASIVIGVDESRRNEPAVRWAAGVAAQRARSLRIVHGLGVGPLTTLAGNHYAPITAAIDRLQSRAENAVERARRTAHAVDPNLAVTVDISQESAAHLLVRESLSAYQVVLGAAGSAESGVGRVGSTVLAVASHGYAPVVTVRGDSERPTQVLTGPVVLGVDGSPAGEAAIGVAFDEASWRRTHLVAVHVWSDLSLGTFGGRHEILTPPQEFEQAQSIALAERLAGWQEKYPDVAVTRKIYLDGPRQNLLRWSQRAELVVVGSHGRGALVGTLLGSTSYALALQARCPVMVVRA